MTARRKTTAAEPALAKRRLADCAPGDVAQTAAGFLLVTGAVNGSPLCRLWEPNEERVLSQPFGVPPDVAVIRVTRRPAPPPTAGGGNEFDPVRG